MRLRWKGILLAINKRPTPLLIDISKPPKQTRPNHDTYVYLPICIYPRMAVRVAIYDMCIPGSWSSSSVFVLFLGYVGTSHIGTTSTHFMYMYIFI